MAARRPTKAGRGGRPAAQITLAAWLMMRIFGAEVKITGEITSPPGSVAFGIDLGSIPVGKALAQLVSWAQPGRTVSFDPPWDRLLDLTLPPSTFTIRSTPAGDGGPVDPLTAGASTSFEIRVDDMGVDFKPFLTVDSLALAYTPDPRAVDFQIHGSFLGQSFTDPPLSWDVLSSRPPAVPSATDKVFELRYLGLGQRIKIKPPSTRPAGTELEAPNPSLWNVIQSLENAYARVPSDQPPIGKAIDFAPDGGWLVGFDFTLAQVLTVAALFNDPTMYGLHLALGGAKAGGAAGLSFDILYRKVNDNLGVYHAELVLPDALRHLEFGQLSITLPVIAVDVYTNGDFLVDLGFPYQLDFSRSFAIQLLPFVGAGGFYLGMLSQQSATALPSPATGSFAPVVAFGFGLQVGVGKTVSYGPLSGGITVTVQGSIEGLIAGWRPGSGRDLADVYYKITGQVSVSGHLYATIDFVIMKASVDVYAFAGVALVMESYQPTRITLRAGVRVSVSVKIVFFKIRLSFAATIEESFVIGSASTAPWDAQGARALMAAGRTRRRLAAASGRPPRWQAVDLVSAGSRDAKATVTVGIVPWATFGRPQEHSPAAVAQVAALCFIDAAMPDAHTPAPEADATSFGAICDVLFAWAMQRAASGEEAVTQTAVQALFDELAKPEGDGGMPTEMVLEFLVENVQFKLTDGSSFSEEHVTAFPMLPWLRLSSAATPAFSVDFALHNLASPAYRDKLGRYFAQLDPSTDGPTGAGRSGAPAAAAPLPRSLTAVLTADWCKLVLRQLLGDALARFSTFTRPARPSDPGEHFLTWLVHRYGLGPDGLIEIAHANQGNAGLRDAYTIAGCAAQPRADESPNAFCERIMISRQQLADSVGHVQGLLDPTATVTVTGGSYLIAPADVSVQVVARDATTTVPVATNLLSLLSGRFAVTPEALAAANPGIGQAQWTSAGPGTVPEPPPLRAGDVVKLPDARTTVARRTLNALAASYRVTSEAVLAANAEASGLFSPLVTVTLPDFTFAAEGRTPVEIAQRFGLTVVDLIAANDTGASAFGQVKIPAAVHMPIDELTDGVLSGSGVTSAAGTVARFLLHGLRLPAPAGDNLGPRGALYQVTGQQFPAPDEPAGASVVVQPTDEAGLAAPEIEFPAGGQLQVPLSADTVNAIAYYRSQLPTPPFDPAILSATRYPPYTVTPRRYPLGQPRTWQRPSPWLEGDGAALPKVYPLPSNLLADLGDAPLGYVTTTLTDPGSGTVGGSTTPVPDARWAVTADFLIRRVPGAGGAGSYAPGMYEIVSSVGSASQQLQALMKWLWADPDRRSASLELLYSASAQANNNSGVRSDAIAAATVALVKANLSTVTAKPSGSREPRAEPRPPLVDATMDEPEFIQLLWESSTVNAGGYFLQYGPEGATPLPDILFEAAPLATLTVIAIASDQRDPERAPLRPFHNAVVSTVDANSAKVTVDVEARQRDVPPTATTLAEAAAALEMDVADFGAANATNDELLQVGTHVADPLFPGGRYAIQAGDDILALAQLMGVTAPDAAGRLANAALLVAKPVTAWPQLSFLTRSSPLPAGLAGFRLTRVNPDPGSGTGDVRAQERDAEVALATSYQLLSYDVAGGDGFIASNDAMPLAPVSPGRPGSRTWRYQQVLPVAALVPDDPSPYAAVGRTATVQFALQDLYGNRALPAGEPADLPLPVYYNDQLIPIASWPKAQVQFTAGEPGSGALLVTLALDVASTVASAASDPGLVATRAVTEGERYALAGMQLDRADVRVTIANSLSAATEQLSNARLAAFAAAAGGYLAALAGTRAVSVSGAGQTLGGAASLAGISVADLATANQDAEGLLEPNAPLTLPVMASAVLGDSLDSISGRFPDTTAALLGSWNRAVTLAPDVTITLDGGQYVTKPGDTLASLAPADPGGLAAGNATVAGLYQQGTTLVVSTGQRPYEGDSLRLLAAEAGTTVAVLAAVNASAPLSATSSLLVPGRLNTSAVSGPADSIHRVAAGETLTGIAAGTGIEAADLVVANSWNENLLVPQTHVSYGGETVTVRAGDTMQSVAGKLAAAKVLVDVATLFLAPGNDKPGRLTAEAVLLLPPAVARITVAVTPALDDGPVVPLTVTTTVARTANVDPQLAGAAAVASVTSPVAAKLTGTDPQSVSDFGKRFEAAFANWNLRLATGAGEGASTAGGASFHVVQITFDWDGAGTPLGIAYRFEDAQVTFSVPPVSQQPWSADRVPVARYVSGAGLGADVPTRASAVDLQAIQVRMAADLDRFLEPGSALAAYGYSPQHVRDIVSAKYSLARHVSQTVLPVLAAGSGEWEGDLASARKAMRQLMLVQAAQAYTTDALVQVKAKVRTPDAAGLRARLNGMPMPLAVPLAAEGVADGSRLRRWQARGHEHLRMLISALGGSLRAEDDRAEFASRNAGALLAAGQQVAVGRRRHVVLDGESLADVAAALGVTAAKLVTAAPDILAAPGSCWSLGGSEPPLTLTPAKLELVADGETALTFALRTSSLQQHRSVSPRLGYRPTELEYAIEDVGDGYESSRWLAFVTARPESPLGQPTIPLPLRCFPSTPQIVSQTATQVETKPTWATLGDGDFTFALNYQEADQDTVTVRVEGIHGSVGGRPALGDDDPLAIALVRYQSVADALWADLAPLGSTAGAPNPGLQQRCSAAVEVFAQLVGEIATAWEGHSAAGGAAAAVSSAGQRVTSVVRPDGRRRVTLHPLAAGGASLSLAGRSPAGRRTLPGGAEQVLCEAGVPALPLAPWPFKVPTDQQLRGIVDVVRNMELVPGRQTTGAFTYQLLNTRASAPARPLIRYAGDLDLRKVSPRPFTGSAMVDHVRNLLAAALLVTPGTGTPTCFVSVSSAWEYGFGTEAPIDAGDVHAVPAPAYTGYAHLLDPSSDFAETAGYSAELAGKLLGWQAQNQPPSIAAQWCLSLTAFAALGSGSAVAPGPQLLQVARVILPLSAVSDAKPVRDYRAGRQSGPGPVASGVTGDGRRLRGGLPAGRR